MKPNIDDYEFDTDYVVACECYGIQLEYEEEAKMAEQEAIQNEIEEIRKEIKEFADRDQYSVNNPYVKSLYNRLRELEGREQIKEEDYEPQFIDGSDVPIGGYYE